MVADIGQQRVTAAGDQSQERGLEFSWLEEARGKVAVKVIDGRKRQLTSGRQALGRTEADEQRGDKPGAARGGDEFDVIEAHLRDQQSLVDDRRQQCQVMTRRYLRDDSAEAVVHAL